MKKSSLASARPIASLLKRHFVDTGLVHEYELKRRIEANSKYHTPAIAGSLTAKDFCLKIEAYRRILLLRLLDKELRKLCINIGQKQEVTKVINVAILIAKREKRMIGKLRESLELKQDTLPTQNALVLIG